MGCSVKFRNVIEPVMFIYLLMMYLQYPAVQALLYSKICLNNFNETVCAHITNHTYMAEEHFVQGTTSHWILYLNLAVVVPSIFAAMILGRIGDAVSRKYAIIIPIFGQLCCCISYLVNIHFPHLSLGYIIIGSAINGCLGGFSSFIMGVYAYLSATTDKEHRIVRMGILEALTYVSATIGFAIVGVLIDRFGFPVVFWSMLGLTTFALLYTLFIIEDIQPDNHRTNMEKFSYVFSTQGFRDFVGFFRKDRPKTQNRILLLGILVICIVMFITATDIDIDILYLLHPPLKFSKSYVSYFLGFDNVMKAIPLLILLPLFKKCFKVNDCFWAMMGIISKAAGCALLGSSKVAWVVFLVPVVRMYQGFPSAVIRAMLSSNVEVSEQGQLFSVVACSESIMAVLATVIFNNVYAATVTINPGISFYISASFGIFGAIMIGFIWKYTSDKYKDAKEVGAVEKAGST